MTNHPTLVAIVFRLQCPFGRPMLYNTKNALRLFACTLFCPFSILRTVHSFVRYIEYEVIIIVSQVRFCGGVGIRVAPTDKIYVNVINVASK